MKALLLLIIFFCVGLASTDGVFETRLFVRKRETDIIQQNVYINEEVVGIFDHNAKQYTHQRGQRIFDNENKHNNADFKERWLRREHGYSVFEERWHNLSLALLKDVPSNDTRNCSVLQIITRCMYRHDKGRWSVEVACDAKQVTLIVPSNSLAEAMYDDYNPMSVGFNYTKEDFPGFKTWINSCLDYAKIAKNDTPTNVPEVYIKRKEVTSSLSQIFCTAAGYYPNILDIQIIAMLPVRHMNTNIGDLRLLHDGTYMKTVRADVSRDDDHAFKCVVKQSSTGFAKALTLNDPFWRNITEEDGLYIILMILFTYSSVGVVALYWFFKSFEIIVVPQRIRRLERRWG